MNIDVLFQNEQIIVVNKPSGVLVHPSKESNDKISVLKILRDELGHFLYPIHRLDRPVSGVLIFGKTSEAASIYSNKLNSKETIKKYSALCKGTLKEKVVIDSPLLSQDKTKSLDAYTELKPIKTSEFVSLVEVSIKTGRYHQIRRHCSRVGHQIIGDSMHGKGKYNKYYRENFGLNRIFLHCSSIELGGEKFIAPMPNELESVIQQLGLNK